MSDITTSDSKALTVQQRATLALGLADVEKTLTALAESSKSITAITNGDGYDQCHSARMVLVRQRLDITKRGKEAREDAQKFSKAVIAEEGRLVALIEPEEKRLQKLQDAHDAAIAAAKEARIAAELKRVSDLLGLVSMYRNAGSTLSASSGSKTIAEVLADLEVQPVDGTFEEFEQQAADAKGASLKRLQDLHSAALAHEEEQRKIQAEREELARLRADQARRDAEDRARREAEEREARKVREEEERRAAEQRARQKAEDDRIAAERKAILDAQEAEAKIQRDAEASRQRLEREAHEAQMRREREEQEAVAKAERDRIAAERAQLAKEQEAARKAAEPAPIAAARTRPLARDLVTAVAGHFKVTPEKALGWLRATDFSKAQDAA